jgi:hypothetical protein
MRRRMAENPSLALPQHLTDFMKLGIVFRHGGPALPYNYRYMHRTIIIRCPQRIFPRI